MNPAISGLSNAARGRAMLSCARWWSMATAYRSMSTAFVFRFDGDAAPVGPGIEPRHPGAGGDETLQQRQVQPADQWRVRAGQRVERAVAQPDGTAVVRHRFVAQRGQPLQQVAAGIGGTVGAGRLVGRGLGAGPLLAHGLANQGIADRLYAAPRS